MTTTLVERLRIWNMVTMNEAADRIEELERQLAERDEKIATLDADVRTEQIWVKHWHSQVALLREALWEIAENGLSTSRIKAAKAALAATEDKGHDT